MKLIAVYLILWPIAAAMVALVALAHWIAHRECFCACSKCEALSKGDDR